MSPPQPVSSYLTFSPLSRVNSGRYSFLRHYLSVVNFFATAFPLGSVVLYVARTFLPGGRQGGLLSGFKDTHWKLYLYNPTSATNVHFIFSFIICSFFCLDTKWKNQRKSSFPITIGNTLFFCKQIFALLKLLQIQWFPSWLGTAKFAWRNFIFVKNRINWVRLIFSPLKKN